MKQGVQGLGPEGAKLLPPPPPESASLSDQKPGKGLAAALLGFSVHRSLGVEERKVPGQCRQPGGWVPRGAARPVDLSRPALKLTRIWDLKYDGGGAGHL